MCFVSVQIKSICYSYSVLDVPGEQIYKVHTEALSWVGARDRCRADGGHLANTFPLVPLYIRNLVNDYKINTIEPLNLPELGVPYELGDEPTHAEFWIGKKTSSWVWLKGKYIYIVIKTGFSKLHCLLYWNKHQTVNNHRHRHRCQNCTVVQYMSCSRLLKCRIMGMCSLVFWPSNCLWCCIDFRLYNNTVTCPVVSVGV